MGVDKTKLTNRKYESFRKTGIENYFWLWYNINGKCRIRYIDELYNLYTYEAEDKGAGVDHVYRMDS